MPTVMSAAAESYLGTTGAYVIPTLEIVRDLLNADLRQYIDVTDRVIEFDELGGDSTLRNLKWKRPGMTPTVLLEEDNYLTPGHADSLWTSWNLKPTECYVRFRISVRLPDGSLEELRRYYGKIVDLESRVISQQKALALVTIIAVDEAMSAGITKASGDESVYIGTTW